MRDRPSFVVAAEMRDLLGACALQLLSDDQLFYALERRADLAPVDVNRELVDEYARSRFSELFPPLKYAIAADGGERDAPMELGSAIQAALRLLGGPDALPAT